MSLARFLFLNFLLLTLFSFGSVISGREVSASVFISEFMPDPSGSDEHKEWVELYNLTDTPVDISGWKIQSYNGPAPIDETTLIHESRNKVVRNGIVIAPKSYIVLTDIPNETGILDSITMFETSRTLNLYNSNAFIILRDSTDQIIDYLYFGTSTSGRSWERKGPLCSELTKASSHTGLTQNSNHDPACWPEVVSPSESTVYEGIQFSLDNTNWYDSLDIWGPARIYFRFKLSGSTPNYVSNPIWKDQNGNVLSNPTVLENYEGVIHLEITLNDTFIEDQSQSIKVTQVDPNLLLEGFNFSTDQTDWNTTILAKSNTPIHIKIDLGYQDLQIDSIKFYDNSLNELLNPFTFWQYQGVIRTVVNIAGIEFFFDSQEIEIVPELRVNEFLPKPNLDESQWVEIINQNSFSVPLNFFSLTINDEKFDLQSSQDGFNSCSTLAHLDTGQICVFYFANNSDILPEEGSFSLNYKDLQIQTITYTQTQQNQSISYWEGQYVSDGMQITGGLPNQTKVLNYTLMITELYASPQTSSGEIEWLEIYNFGTEEIPLTGVYLKDRGTGEHEYGTKTGYLPNVILNPKEHFVISQPELYILLNNSGDTITLFSPEGQILDSVTYTISKAGESYNRVFASGEYTPSYTGSPVQLFASTILTPGEQNEFPTKNGIGTSDELTLKTITEAKTLADGNTVYIEGIASVEPNFLGVNTFYIQDATGGIRIELDSGVSFAPYAGQRIRLIGTISEAYTERRIHVSSLDNIFTHDDLGVKFNDGTITAFDIPSLGDLESLEGVLVYIEGEIIGAYSTSFDVETNFGVIRVGILSSTGISLSKSKGDTVKIYGILSQYNGVYRVLPRYRSDILLIKPTPPIKTRTVKKFSTISTKSKLSPSILATNTKSPTKDISLVTEKIYVTPLSQSLILSEIYIWPFWMLLFVFSLYSFVFLNLQSLTVSAKKLLDHKEKFRFDDKLRKYYDST